MTKTNCWQYCYLMGTSSYKKKILQVDDPGRWMRRLATTSWRWGARQPRHRGHTHQNLSGTLSQRSHSPEPFRYPLTEVTLTRTFQVPSRGVGHPPPFYLQLTVFRIRIRRDPGFFANPGTDFNNTDPSVFCFNLL